MKKLFTLFLSLGAVLSTLTVARADLRDGLISYWPLDALQLDPNTSLMVTPDFGPHTNHLTDNFTMTTGDFVPGARSNAATFDGTTKYLYRAYPVGDDAGLPVYNARYYTVAMWVKATGFTQQARTLFAEGNTTAQPLFVLRTDQANAPRTNILGALIRNNNNNALVGGPFDLGKSTLMPLDGTWHHIAWVDSNGVARLYVDGTLDPRVFRNTRLAEPTGVNSALTLSTLALGVTFQAAPVANTYFNGQLDDVAIWERTLSQAEINDLRSNGIPSPIIPSSPVIVYDPVGDTNLLVGESFSLLGLASGTHPRTYQWYKDGTPLVDDGLTILGSTSNLLVLPLLDLTNSGGYSVVISNSQGFATSSTIGVTINTTHPQVPNLTNSQIAYWPLDTVQGITTPDVVRGQDMFLYLMSSTNLVTGRFGSAMSFHTNGMLSRFHSVNDALPVNQYQNFTISLWVNAPNINPGAGGLRFYTECHSTSTQPTFSLANGDNNTTPRGPLTKLRAFIRNDNGNNNADAGASGTDAFFDLAVTNSTWHHVVYVQRWVGGASPVLQANWYIDGVRDDPIPAGNQLISPRAPLSAQLSTIGGQWRAGGTDPLGNSGRSFPFVGLIDDFAIWNRALTPQEILLIATNANPVPAAPAVLPAFVINSFQGDFAQVVNGGNMVLKWNVAGLTGSGLALSINNGIGSVLARTTNGVGTLVVSNIASTITYTLTAQRDTNVLTAPTTVTVVNGVAAGWNILDNFETYTPGAFVNPYWSDLLTGSQIEDVSGNRVLNTPGGNGNDGRVATLLLGAHNINQGQSRTLFARVYVADDPFGTTMLNRVGVTDKTMRTAADVGGDTGPIVRLNDDPGGDLAIGAIDGTNNPITLIPRKLEQFQVYNVWLDVANGAPTATNSGDTFSVWVQRLGEADRLLIASNYRSDRDLLPDFAGTILNFLNKVVVANANATGTVYVDDLYISTSGFNATVPAPWTGPTPPAVGTPSFLSVDSTSQPGFIVFNWDAGALMWAPTVDGPWTVQPLSFGFVFVFPVDQADPQHFFRLRR